MRTFLVFTVFAACVCAQSATAQNELTGNLALDCKNVQLPFVVKQNFLPEPSRKKSPALAGVMSLIIPGAGEIYTEHYYEAAVFLAIDAAAIAVAVHYNNKGDDQTNYFQGVADVHWSAVKYAEWLNRYKQANIPIDPNTALPPWQRVNWDSLNYYESEFSHKLPAHGQQQYYELIGKYPQYSPGWDEFDPNDGDYHHVPAILLQYAGMRGQANDYYNYAAKSVIALYINHVLSGVNAIWGAVSYNKNLSVSGNVGTKTYFGYTDYETSLKIKYFIY